jgi:acylphosphatase
MQEKVRAHLIVQGRVQGVFFREETRKTAKLFGVYGWVKNKPDGTVESIVEGEKKDVVSLINWCKNGSPLSQVEKVDVVWQDYRGAFREFDIQYL